MSNYDKFEKVISNYNLSGEEVLRLLTGWNGTEIISDEFLNNLNDVEDYEVEE